ncbi:hypothetical protein AAMO2058_001258800 [Amorphochlora amoebiformis]
MADEPSPLRDTIRRTREMLTKRFQDGRITGLEVSKTIEHKAQQTENKRKSLMSSFWTWRDTTNPKQVLGGVAMFTFIVSRPGGNLAMIRNSMIATLVTSWVMYPKETFEKYTKAQAFVKAVVKRTFD